MGHRKEIPIDSNSKEQKRPFNSLNNVKKFNSGKDEKQEKCAIKKKDLINVIKSEYVYISNLFDVLDLASLSHGRRTFTEDDDDDDSEDMQGFNIPEKIILKKNASKKGLAQSSFKSKSFPQTIDGLEKELEDLKGTPMTYQRTLRKKGLQSRLIKKKRKENIKQQKALIKLGKKGHIVNGPLKLVKAVINSDGNVVSNKFDFADCELKKENKRKLGTFSEGNADISPSTTPMFTKISSINQPNAGCSVNDSSKDTRLSIKNDKHNSSAKSIKVESLKEENVNEGIDKKSKSMTLQKPIFNKENKMVFSRVFISEDKKLSKNKTDKNPKKILQKLKENSKRVLELEKENKEKATLLQEKQKWAAALKRATGEKVRDDPELLKKSIAREKNKKVKSQKKWQARLDRVQKEKDDKQKKRTDNIQAKKSEKKKRKLKKAIKKGSYVQL